MSHGIRRFLLICLSVMALAAVLTFGAQAYEYPSMPSNWQNVQVTVGDVTMPFARYPSGAVWSDSKQYMTLEEQADYGINLGSSLWLRSSQCMAFARYAYAALYFKYPQDASLDTTLAADYSSNYAYRNMIQEVLGTRSISSGYDAYTLKTLITACQPGAVMRVGDPNTYGHSLVIMAIYNDGFIAYDANFGGSQMVDVRPYTWQQFVDSQGYRGITALQMPAYYPGWSYSTGENIHTVPDTPVSYELDTSSAGTYEVYNCSSLNVRSKPSTDGDWKGSLNAGTTVDVLGTYLGWAQIQYNGNTSWVYTDYLRAPSMTVTVNFDANGGSASYSSDTYTAGRTFGSLPTATKRNRTFMGWTDGTRIYTAGTLVPAVSSLTLKAQWAILTYQDVSEDAWYANYVGDAYHRNLLTPGTEFRPEENATRSELVTVLGREYEAETGDAITNSGMSPFYDVSAWSYYSKYVTWASYVGITKGTSDYYFEPDANLTREQLAEFLYRLAIYTGYTRRTEPDYYQLYYSFYDWYLISDWAQSAICWAVDEGILQGDEYGYMNPQGNATRAEMVTMMSRYIDFVNRSYRLYDPLDRLQDLEEAEAAEDASAEEPAAEMIADPEQTEAPVEESVSEPAAEPESDAVYVEYGDTALPETTEAPTP